MSGDTLAALRILDAAANRAAEGLRVVEEHARLALDDAHLTGLCKQLRHDLAAALKDLPESSRLAARDTSGDVGARIATGAEGRRESLSLLLTANFKRAQQALRTLEEYGKLAAPTMAPAMESLRYRCYTLEKAFEAARRGGERLAHAPLCVLVDGGDSDEDFSQRISTLVAAGVSMIQLRDKALSDRELLERARRLRSLTSESGALFIMNDRPDLAALAHADGVHVGQDDLSVHDAQRIAGPDALIGVSTHSLPQARQAVLDGAHYLGVGPTFPSTTKQFDRFPGLELVRSVSAEISLPAFAIGGVDSQTLPQVRAAGLSRIAVSGAVWKSPDCGAAAKRLLEMLRQPTVSGQETVT